MIEIKELNFNNNVITKTISMDKKIGVLIEDETLLKSFLLLISGINKSNNIFYHEKIVYDNKDFFKDRIYLDSRVQLINTLISEKISKNLLDNYDLFLKEDKFDELVNKLNIRSLGKLDDNYEFNEEGISLINNIISLSLFKYTIMLKPFENIKNTNHLNLVKEEYIDKGLLFGISDLKNYTNFFDEIIYFYNDNMFNFTNDTTLLVVETDNLERILLPGMDLLKKIVYKDPKNTKVILDNDNLTKDEIKLIKEIKPNMHLINLFSIGEEKC